jgi:hypothetical protein
MRFPLRAIAYPGLESLDIDRLEGMNHIALILSQTGQRRPEVHGFYCPRRLQHKKIMRTQRA